LHSVGALLAESKVIALNPGIHQFTLSAEEVQKLCAAENGFDLC